MAVRKWALAEFAEKMWLAENPPEKIRLAENPPKKSVNWPNIIKKFGCGSIDLDETWQIDGWSGENNSINFRHNPGITQLFRPFSDVKCLLAARCRLQNCHPAGDTIILGIGHGRD